jgi:hypothetical protein
MRSCRGYKDFGEIIGIPETVDAADHFAASAAGRYTNTIYRDSVLAWCCVDPGPLAAPVDRKPCEETAIIVSRLLIFDGGNGFIQISSCGDILSNDVPPGPRRRMLVQGESDDSYEDSVRGG